MNALSYILAGLVLAAFIAALVYCIKHRPSEKCSGCNKDCAGCRKRN